MDRFRRARTVFVTLLAIGVLGVPAWTALAGATHAAVDPATGFMVDSETGNPFGGGQVHDYFPSTLTATGTTSDLTIVGSGWTFKFAKTGGWIAGTNFDGGSTFLVQRNGSSCSSSDWTYDVYQPPVVANGIVTTFAVDFWRNRCGAFSTAAMFGSIRIGSTVPVAMVHTTSSLEFPDTYEDAIAPDQSVLVQNVGETFVTVDAAVLSGPHAGDYSIVDGCAPVILDPGQECTIAVTFDPKNTTQRTASITVPTSGYGPDRVVDLAGYGLSPILRTNSALVIDGLPDAFTDGEHWYDPTVMTATGSSDSLRFLTQDWDARFQSPDGLPLGPGLTTTSASRARAASQAFGWRGADAPARIP